MQFGGGITFGGASGAGISLIDPRGPNPYAPNVLYLVVGGGGGGGYVAGGGGGAGGFTTGIILNTQENQYAIYVGAGGPGGNPANGTNGGNSAISLNSSNVVIGYGGGGGGSSQSGGNKIGNTGGSGGGTVAPNTTRSGNIAGQGFSGGLGADGQYYQTITGGGGGAGGQGGDQANDYAGPGGIGLQSNITGTLTYYAGGGGGGSDRGSGFYGQNPGNASLGGGGRGGLYQSFYDGAWVAPTAGNVNTGGGGGGSGPTVPMYPSNSGGSGIVVLSHPAANYSQATTTGSPNIILSGGNVIYRFWQSGTISFIIPI